jgi:hypothetical protein
MDGSVIETPQRKRSRSATPSSSSSRRVNKRFRPDTLLSLSPKSVSLDPANGDEDVVLESDVPESPIAPSRPIAALSVSFAPNTPLREINDPFAKLNLKTSAQKKNLATPVASKTNSDGSKSVRKSARKTPGTGKSNKCFRIKVFSRVNLV